MVADLKDFAELYAKRPLADNEGGMKAPHMFATWFALRALKPKAIIESGVFRGQGTWLIEQACPEAKLYCIDPNLGRIAHRVPRAEYFDRDFSALPWDGLPREQTLLFFDDHQNAYERIKTARWFGFRHLIFEDNYPASTGDCYSLKKAFAGAGLQRTTRSFGGMVSRRNWEVEPNDVDAVHLRRNLEVYYEFPPVIRARETRWGDTWSDTKYPTPAALLEKPASDEHRVYAEEARDYTWICYARLRAGAAEPELSVQPT
jgi:hypothetical protein